MRYAERPSRHGVIWTRTAPAGQTGRVLPDGCLDLLWDGRVLLVAGPDTRAFVTTAPAETAYTGLRFRPGTGPRILGVPARELRDQRVPLAALWPGARVRRLTERIAEAPDPAALLAGLAAVGDRDAGPVDPVVGAVLADLGRPVADSAAAVGLSERQLHRRCQAAFGYGAKTLARILRMERALALARAGLPFASVAAVAGYADQAHLSREVKSLTGLPLGELSRT
ncbi:MAG: helix-turn-helix transcriptional regulator [Streptosporangiaceae bacterium]